MDYISKLSDDELRIICRLIPIKFFRDCFKQSPKQFHKVFSGQRAETISLEKVESLVPNNRNAAFISDILNTGIQTLLDSINSEISKLTNSGTNIHTALLRVLPKSVFYEHIDLYLKLSESTYIPEYAELMQRAIREIEEKSEAAAAEQAVITQEDTVAELSKLQKELENVTQKLEEQQSKKETQDAIYRSLQTEYQTLQEVLQNKDLELAELQRRINHADLPTGVPTNIEYPFLSLCQVGGPNRSSIELYRMADIVDGVIQTQRQEDYPNRNILFTRDHSKAPNYIGIWNWKTKPNDNPEKSDIIDAYLLTSQVPVQIIELSGCRTIDELKENLIRGIDSSPKGERALFSFAADEKYIGLLCNTKDVVIRNGTTKLDSGVIELPLYKFSEQEIVTISGIRFFYRINLGTPKEVFRVKDPLDIVKEAVLRRMSIAKLKSHVTIREAQNLRTFLEEIPTSDFYQELADVCACSIDTVKVYLDDFIRQAGIYLREEDVESKVFESALEHSPSLLDKCRELNEKLWRKNHAEQLEQAQAELEQMSEETRQQQHLYNQLSTQQKQLVEQQEKLTAQITQQEKLAADVEKQVSDRIAAARKNAADFICEMAFTMPKTHRETASTFSVEQCSFCPGETLSSEISMLYEVQDAICEIQDELEEAGISDQRSYEFASFLYAAYIAHTPLLLVGPNGLDIADALSIALFGRTASILRCESKYDSGVIEQCINDENPSIAVLNLLHTGWVNNIHELLAKMERKFVIIIHPFAEDLLIEPRGLYNYMLPVLTELFVDQKATRNFVGGCFHSDFQNYTPAKPQKSIPLSAKLAMPSLVKNRLCQILSDMKVLLENDSNDSDLLFGTVPYAYATGKIEIIREEIQSNQSFSKDTKTLLLSFLGESE